MDSRFRGNDDSLGVGRGAIVAAPRGRARASIIRPAFGAGRCCRSGHRHCPRRRL